MEPISHHPKAHFSSTGALIPVFGRTFSPTGENRIAENRRIGGFQPADSPPFPGSGRVEAIADFYNFLRESEPQLLKISC
jgi:hypothetical protein